jgi:hypothetical protein
VNLSESTKECVKNIKNASAKIRSFGSPNVTINIHGCTNPQEIARQVAKHLKMSPPRFEERSKETALNAMIEKVIKHINEAKSWWVRLTWRFVRLELSIFHKTRDRQEIERLLAEMIREKLKADTSFFDRVNLL